MSKQLQLTIGSILAVVACFLFSYSYADALTITPVRFEVKGNPGDLITEEFLLFNESAVEETFYPSFANFEAQGETGNPSFVEPRDGLGTWMETVTAVTIAPNTSVKIPFKIRIPADADPGGYFAVVLFGDTPPQGAGRVSVGSKIGTLVLLSVNGEVKEAGGLFDFGMKDGKFFYNTLPAVFTYRFRNDGGDRIKPEGDIKIRNTFFIKTETLNANPVEGNILPGSTRRFEVEWVEKKRADTYQRPEEFFAQFLDDVKYQFNNFAFGLYFAKMSLTYGINQSFTADSNYTIFFVFPWQLLIVCTIVFLLIWFVGGRILRRYNRYVIEKAGIEIKKNSRSNGK